MSAGARSNRGPPYRVLERAAVCIHELPSMTKRGYARRTSTSGVKAIRIRVYAAIVGILLLLVALLRITGPIPTAFPADLFHASVGAFFALLGFLQRDAEALRQVIGGMGVLLVIGKGIILFILLAWGEAPFHGPIEITCFIAGVLSILAARHL